jgi:hypothetical protein
MSGGPALSPAVGEDEGHQQSGHTLTLTMALRGLGIADIQLRAMAIRGGGYVAVT